MNEWNEAAKHLQDASIEAAIARCVAPLRDQIKFIEDRMAIAAAMEAAYREPEPHSKPATQETPSDDAIMLCAICAVSTEFGVTLATARLMLAGVSWGD